MARRRKKRARSNASATQPPQPAAEQTTSSPVSEESLAHDDSSTELNRDATPQHTPQPDISCLLHPGRDVETDCDRCNEPLCRMCAVSFGAEQLCSECFGQIINDPQRVGGKPQGLGALVLGLTAITSMLALALLPKEASIHEVLPSGKAFWSYSAIASAAISISLGASAQDFQGIGQRAGAIGAIIAALSLFGMLALRLSSAAA